MVAMVTQRAARGYHGNLTLSELALQVLSWGVGGGWGIQSFFFSVTQPSRGAMSHLPLYSTLFHLEVELVWAYV